MESLNPLFTLIGTIVTTIGTIIVAIITTKSRKENKSNKDAIVEELADIKKELKSNTACSVSTARGLISQVYTANKDKKELSEKSWRNVCDLYEAYKTVKIDGHTPNSWCDALVEEMKAWKKI